MSSQIYGIRAVLEAINAGQPINKIFIQKGLKGDLYKELESSARKSGIGLSYVPVEKLNRLTRNNNHQGAVAQISPVEFHQFEELVEQVLNKEETPLFLMLDGDGDHL